MPALHRSVDLATQDVDFDKVAQYLLPMMLRNFSSTGFTFTDPWTGVESAPGCIIASPSYNLTQDGIPAADDPNVRQNYIFNWSRDAAIVIIETASANWPFLPGVDAGVFDEYVSFAALCQQNQQLNFACYTVDGKLRTHPKNWILQNDGPALQTLALLAIWDKLSATARTAARQVAIENITWLLANYPNPCGSPWEEREGECFFTLAVILRCLQAVRANSVGLPVPPGLDTAAATLEGLLDKHWSEPDGSYVSIGRDFSTGDYDPNLDIVLACLYGAIPSTDDRLLSTAAKLRDVWAVPPEGEAVPSTVYQVNKNDWPVRGPLLGRYPNDQYDGDFGSAGGHPWALCTSAFAALYYRVASDIRQAGAVTVNGRTARFFQQVGIKAAMSVDDAVSLLCEAGDKMLTSILYHSNHLELSEQFDANSGFEKSVQNLTWSYASFLSALRARRL